MPSPAITRLDAAKASTIAQTLDNATIGGTTATANVTTSTDPTQNAAAAATNSLAANQDSVATAANVIEGAKQLAAFSAVDHHILPHHKVIGIGSGSTVPYVVDRIVQQGPEANQGRVFIPTGFQSKELIVKAGLTLGDVDQFPQIDVTIDGADEVDADLNCIKGGGACHLREKVLAEAAETWVVVADYRKNSRILGTTYKQGVPIEVAPFAYAKLLQNVHRLGSEKAVLRMAKAKAGPVVTDNGNFVIDAPFDESSYTNPRSILEHIKLLTGVVEVGLFCGMAKAAYFGNQDGSVTIKWADGNQETLQASDIQK
ncbi:ribose-5-phosphate isomerase rki1 [Serendipita sp. 396]|nr:ribose-5-phosphate isomerase rki1 [Serendipita sp. 396]KAG8785186.1 ribose-5-phosphate isomerase rki1 [Serendipita sp. 397]KAG8800795.1 ribose-5-phosphate isomerase rki1 [Serendipita sp. 398]KAG8824281.1 ribose-5-phosphate isomerase rki1 [Serendipita sp. 401]KAG8835640.1 ribose-5-phosphate isomerase rki1 [Serendipita sp. 400]KAG8857878.1 ribose-5-phosphate isomerase rki1 [Serendipita sp. 411]KAG8869529.1 ribose-5-phosphate isomerase rki1 [Serendipita sp. 405]KAG9055307.1 ribose-5-phosphat